MGDSDTFDYSLRKFKKQVEKAGILSELKKRQHFEKPSIQKKKKFSFIGGGVAAVLSIPLMIFGPSIDTSGPSMFCE